jgi:hypothetical protein
MLATGELSVAIPRAWRDATCDTADIGQFYRAGTVAPLLGRHAAGERRGLNDVRARYQRTGGRGQSAGGWSNGVTTPRKEAPPC